MVQDLIPCHVPGRGIGINYRAGRGDGWGAGYTWGWRAIPEGSGDGYGAIDDGDGVGGGYTTSYLYGGTYMSDDAGII